MRTGGPDFSPLAADYAASRPSYPDELYDWVASEVTSHRLAWDCATGNGQAAIHLVERFERVIATDVSEAQLAQAFRHPRIDYRQASAEESGLERVSVDVVTVAAAAHWFDSARFLAEVERVLRPGGLLVVWTYHVGRVGEPFDEILGPFYFELLAPYFEPGARLVDGGYADLPLSGEPVDPPRFEAVAHWRFEDMRRFVASWSGARTFQNRHGEDPFERIREPLSVLWTDPDERLPLRFPLHVKARRF